MQTRRRRPSVQFDRLEPRQLLAAVRSAAPVAAPLVFPASQASVTADSVTAGVLTGVADIGSVGSAGAFSFADDGTYSLSGSGSDVGGVADGFTFASTPAVQDIVVSARVSSIAASSAGAASGVMIRNGGNAAAGAPMAALVVTAGLQLKLIVRATPNSTATATTLPGVSAPQFVRLTRTGFAVSASYSPDGVTWTAVGAPATITFDSGASRVGIVVASHNTAQTNASTFTNVAVIGGGSTWLQTDVGTSSAAGSAGYDSVADTYELIGRAAGVDSAGDGFNFVSQPLAGDGSVIARDASAGAAGTTSGVMMRADTSAGSAFAAMLISAGQVSFAWRTTTGGVVQSLSTNIAASSLSLKVVRSGNNFQGYYSDNDGATWRRVLASATVSIAMPATVNAGLVAAAAPGATASVDAVFTGVSVGAIPLPGAGILTGDDELFLNDLEARTTLWFTNTQNTTSGLFPDRANAYPGYLGGDSSIAATGFGLSALVIAASRGLITDGYARAYRTLNFLLTDADMTNPSNHGFFYHFVNQTTGARSGTAELSTIDTALGIAGVLTVGQYWKGTPLETMANQIYNRVDWTFMQPDGAGKKLRMAWTPESGFSSATWDSWSEGPLLYLLAMGSPTHAINAASWLSFARNTNMSTYGGKTFYDASGSPLFTNQYPQGWFDLRGKADLADADPSPTKTVHLDPFINSQTHTLAQRQASIDAAAGTDVRYYYYGANAWGLTASDGPNGYKVYGGPPINSNVDGTIAPTAPGGSLAFTPRESIDDLQNLKATYPSSYRAWGFVDAFNPRPTINWYDNDALGIDDGMLLVAAENLRSGLMWNTFMSHPAAQTAVALAFSNDGAFAPPALNSSSFAFETGQAVSLVFTQDVSASLDSTDLSVTNLTTGQTFTSNSWTLQKSLAGQPTSATVTFTSPLPDGRYELRVLANSVSRSDSTTNVNDLVVPFFVLAGDANRDSSVTFDDLLVLAQNYGKTGQTFSQGNFDYSADGSVNFDDLLLLAQHYGTGLPTSVDFPAKSPTRAKPRSLAADVVG